MIFDHIFVSRGFEIPWQTIPCGLLHLCALSGLYLFAITKFWYICLYVFIIFYGCTEISMIWKLILQVNLADRKGEFILTEEGLQCNNCVRWFLTYDCTNLWQKRGNKKQQSTSPSPSGVELRKSRAWKQLQIVARFSVLSSKYFNTVC